MRSARSPRARMTSPAKAAWRRSSRLSGAGGGGGGARSIGSGNRIAPTAFGSMRFRGAGTFSARGSRPRSQATSAKPHSRAADRASSASARMRSASASAVSPRPGRSERRAAPTRLLRDRIARSSRRPVCESSRTPSAAAEYVSPRTPPRRAASAAARKSPALEASQAKVGVPVISVHAIRRQRDPATRLWRVVAPGVGPRLVPQ